MNNTIDFIEELDQDFIDYCYQTNVERAFPAIDGLKPGQRACLFEMFRKGYIHSKPHVKSAKVAGGVIAELWPHGDVAIYETFARMSQSFINNLPLCEFHGSNGNQIIPEPASSRYTEVRLSDIGLEMFNGIKKNNVPFILNFDETVKWPEVLPVTIPTLLINGSEGIGTTIAQKWLPYDFKEATTAFKNYITSGIMDFTLVPSFPSGGIIVNKDDAADILKTGKGKIILRAKADIKNNVISITEICYQTCVRDLMEDFKKLYSNDELPGVEDIQNMSGKNGVRIDIICEKTANPATVLNMLYEKTDLQKSYSANQNILLNKVPQLINTETYFKLLYEHNDVCLINEYTFDKNKALIRKEECEGLLIAIADIDNVITIVRNSKDKDEAKKNLIAKYNFTDHQVETILKMTIGQLTKLDGIKIQDELNDLVKEINRLDSLLNDKNLRKNEIIKNIEEIIKKYPSVRKTEAIQINFAKTKEEKKIETVTPEDVVVITTTSGLIKRVPATSFKVQKKGGVGVKSQDDTILDVVKTNTIDTMMFFTSKGKMYRTVVDNIPSGTNTTKGTPINSLVKLELNEKVIAVSSLHRKTTPKYVLFFTKKGLIKKSFLNEYTETNRNNGIAAIKLAEDDEIADIIFQDEEEVIVISKFGKCIRFGTANIGATGRVSAGVKAINLDEKDEVISALPIHKDSDTLAIFSENGLGKKTLLSELNLQARGGKGVAIYKPSESTGNVIGAAMVSDEDKILLCGTKSSLCISATEIPLLNRTSQGNILIKNNQLTSITKI